MVVRAVVITVLATLAMSSGCGVGTTRPRLVETPIALVAGQTLVTAIDPAGKEWENRSLPPLRFSDGRSVSTDVAALARENSVAWDGWLGDGSAWTRGQPGDLGSQTLLVADIPVDALGQGMWFAGARVPSYWVLPPLEGDKPRRPDAGVVRADRARQALGLLESELRDPWLRWRAGRALERLGVQRPLPSLDDPVLEAIAARWTALSDAAERRLRRADPQTAERWIRVLTRWVSTPETILPVWPTDVQDLRGTILAMLRPTATDDAVLSAARAFLDRQPSWLAWVADDAGSVVGGSISVVNLSDQPALLSVRALGGRWIAHGMLAPDAFATIPAPASSTSDTVAHTQLWEVRLGGRTKLLPISTGALPMEPPGRSIGPFWHDWTLDGLRRGEGNATARGSAGWIGALVHQDPRLDAPSTDASGWAVYVEVARPPCDLPRPGASVGPQDVVRLAFGPTDAPRVELAVRCTGVTTISSLGPGAARGEPALLTTSNDRWGFTLPIHETWLEADGTILMGMQLIPREGPRATWPRPLLPNQRIFGRARIDPQTWGLSEPAATGSQPTAVTP